MTHEEAKELQQRITRRSDEELLNMLAEEPMAYRQEALDFAKAELHVRGITLPPSRAPIAQDVKATNATPDMLFLTSCKNTVEAGLLHGLLTENGIVCEIRRAFLSMALGALPASECYPELWIAGEEDFARAHEIMQEFHRQETTAQPNWNCRACGEENEGQFVSCWSCGAYEDGETESFRAYPQFPSEYAA